MFLSVRIGDLYETSSSYSYQRNITSNQKILLPVTIPTNTKNIVVNLWYTGLGKDALIGKIPENINQFD